MSTPSWRALSCLRRGPAAWRPVHPALGAPAGGVGYAPSGVTTGLAGLIRPGDRLFNPQPWGSWFEFAVPEATVAIDSRIELFPPEVWADYVPVASGEEGWERILDRWGVTVAVVAAADTGAARTPGSPPGWTETYVDADGSCASTKRY